VYKFQVCVFRIWASHRFILDELECTDRVFDIERLIPPGSELSTRVWNARLNKWDVTGRKGLLKESENYPVDFGCSMVLY